MLDVKHFLLLIMLYLCSGFCYTKPESPCNRNDFTCYTNIVREIVKAAVIGNAEQGIEPLDPLKQQLVEGKLQNLEYALKDCTAYGLKDMIVNEISFPDSKHYRIDYSIPYYEMESDYEIKGKLINLAIEGNGKGFLNSTNIHLIVDTEKHFYEKDGKKHLKLTITKVQTELLGTMYINMENLFNGNKELADPLLKFVNENYKIVAEKLQDPVASVIMDRLVKNANKILAEIPVEYLFNMN